jgi:hypothetical protein
MKQRILVLAGIALLLLGGAMTACTADTDDLEERLDAVEAQLGTGNGDEPGLDAMVSGLDILGTAGLHAIDEAANENDTVEAGASGPVQRAVLAVGATAWPADLQADADALEATLLELLEALGSADPAVVGPVAAEAHEQQHDFDHAVSEYVAEQAGVALPEEEEGGETTPAADETPGTEEEGEDH